MTTTTTIKPTFTLAGGTTAATVLRRARLGNSTEDISYSPTGTFGGRFIILDGYDVLLLPPAGSGDGGAQKLFDVRGLAVTGAPRGLAFLESERLFVLNDLRRRSTLLLADLRGRAAGERTIQYPTRFAPDQVEGLDAVNAPTLTGSTSEMLVLSALSFTPTLRSRLELLTRSGDTYRTSRDIVPAEPLGSSFVAGAAFRTGFAQLREGGFVVGGDDFVHLLDPAGNILRSAQVPEAISVEGVAETEAGLIYAADVAAGKLFALGQRLTRLPRLDIDYRIGFGLFSPSGLAWDAAAQRHLVLSTSAATGAPQVAGVPAALDSAEQFIDLAAQNFTRGRRMAYIREESLLAVAHQRNPGAILLFDAKGQLVQTIDVLIDVDKAGSPSALAYIPSTREFAVRVTEPGLAKVLFIFSRDGRLTRKVDLSAAGINSVAALTHFTAQGSPRLLVLDAPLTDADPVTNRAVVTDLDGRPLSEFDTRKSLGVLNPGDAAEITTGEDAGALSIIDRSSGELVVFTLNS